LGEHRARSGERVTVWQRREGAFGEGAGNLR
jgi:hypothetical protein